MAIHYFNFGATFNGNGAAPGPAASAGAPGAWNTPVGVTWVAGDTYRLRRGTTYTYMSTGSSAFALVGLVASAATPTIIEPYSNDVTGLDDAPTQPRPRINQPVAANSQSCIRAWNCSYLIIRGINVTGNTGSQGGGIQLRATSNAEVYDCDAQGNCVGILVKNDAAAEVTNIRIHDNICDNNTLGIGYYFVNTAGSIIRNMVIERNHCWNNTLFQAGVSIGGILNYNVGGDMTHQTDADRGVKQSHIRRNSVFYSGGYGITCINWREGCTCVYNEVAYCNPDRLYDCHATFFGGCFDMRIEHNEIYGQKSYDNMGVFYGSAIAIDMSEVVDQTCMGTGNYVRYNKLYDGDMNPVNVGFSAGAGIMMQNQNACIVEYNDIWNCRNGITSYYTAGALAAGAGTGGHQIRNNRCKDMRYTPNATQDYYTGSGIYIRDGDNSVIENNDLVNCERFGLRIKTGVTGVIERNNNVYIGPTPRSTGIEPPTDANTTPVALDATDLTVDSQRGPSGRLLKTSPLLKAGVYAGLKRDIAGVQDSNPPSIGPYGAATLRKRLVTDPAALT